MRGWGLCGLKGGGGSLGGYGGRERSSVSLQDYSVELGSVDELAWGLK
jgi:hypothetical protein